MFVTDKNYELMYGQATEMNNTYQYLIFGFGFVCLTFIFASITLMRKYQRKILNLEKTKNDIVRNFGKRSLLSDEIVLTTGA